MFKVGQKVLVVGYLPPFDAVVASVGRKWATYTLHDRPFKFNAQTGAMDGGGKVWPSREAYLEKCEDERAWRAFQRCISLSFSTPKVTRARLREMANELGFELDVERVSKVSRIR